MPTSTGGTFGTMHKEEQQGCGVLKARHNRLRRILDQRTELNKPEQCLQHAAE
jgi:hypothetical protein